MGNAFDTLLTELREIRLVRTVGRIGRIGRGRVLVSGLSDEAALHDLVQFEGVTRGDRFGEIVDVGPESVSVIPEVPPDSLRLGGRVLLHGHARVAPADSWLGRVIDPGGAPLDGRPLRSGPVPRRLHAPPPPPVERRGMGARIDTGLDLFNTILPIVRGQRVGLFAGSGVGKSMLLAQLARGMDADVVVIALVGERGREVREFVERALGPEGMKRSVVVAATSDRSALSRRRCMATALTVAEHFRDSGRHVLLLADSMTRHAEAHREVAVAAGEPVSPDGYPPSTVPAITAICERAGPGAGGVGDITAVFTVLVPGSDMESPIADVLRGVLDGHIVLDRQIAERGRFPAVDVLRSVSRSLPDAASPEENAMITRARAVLGVYERAEMMVRAGLYSPGSDAAVDEAIALWPRLDAFAARRGQGGIEASFEALRDSLAAPEGAAKAPAGSARREDRSAAGPEDDRKPRSG